MSQLHGAQKCRLNEMGYINVESFKQAVVYLRGSVTAVQCLLLLQKVVVYSISIVAWLKEIAKIIW